MYMYVQVAKVYHKLTALSISSSLLIEHITCAREIHLNERKYMYLISVDKVNRTLILLVIFEREDLATPQLL